MAGGSDCKASATAISNATPEAPSLAPGTGKLRSSLFFAWSEIGRVSQCAR